MACNRLLHLAPLLACLLLAAALLWWQPPRMVSAALVVTAYLGVCLYLWCRHRQQASPAVPISQDRLLIGYASQGGQAQAIAERSASQLHAAGLTVDVRPLNAIDLPALAQQRRALFVLSTYGEGEAPDNAARFEQRLLHDAADLSQLEFAILALGDRQYTHFCGFARRVEAHLQRLGAQPLFDRLDADRSDPGVLRHWQYQLSHLSGQGDYIDWEPAAYDTWILHSRTLLNPGSQGAPVYELRLRPHPSSAHWQAGDIAEIGPRHSKTGVAEWLERYGIAPTLSVSGTMTAATALASRRLPEGPMATLDAATLLALPQLPHREYSIASIPADGCVQLLVRETRHPDGALGLGSGWLCHHVSVGETVDLRIRSNPGFHGPSTSTPMILIGNGTGLAGLRAHLRERAATPGSRNWLLYGERNAAHDFLLEAELKSWRATGHLERLDLAFSRDQKEKIYVQHLLRDAADEVRQWIKGGAAIYVCGSLEGMGRDVQQILAGILGEAQLHALTEQGRYRRDLY